MRQQEPEQKLQGSVKSQPLLVRLLAALMFMVVSGVGLLSLLSAYAPERSSRFGLAGPLFGAEAQHYGLVLCVIGLMPLVFFARSARQAGWLVGVILVLFWLVLFAPLVMG